MLASFKNSNRKSARQRGRAILIALFILLSAAPQSSIASLVIMLYHNEILYIASDSALTSVGGKRVDSQIAIWLRLQDYNAKLRKDASSGTCVYRSFT